MALLCEGYTRCTRISRNKLLRKWIIDLWPVYDWASLFILWTAGGMISWLMMCNDLQLAVEHSEAVASLGQDLHVFFIFYFWLLCSLKMKVLRIAKIWSGHFINLFPLSQSGRTACLWSIWPSHLMFIEGLAAICASCPSWCGMRRDLEQSSAAQDKSRLKKGIWFAKHFTRSKF